MPEHKHIRITNHITQSSSWLEFLQQERLPFYHQAREVEAQTGKLSFVLDLLKKSHMGIVFLLIEGFLLKRNWQQEELY